MGWQQRITQACAQRRAAGLWRQRHLVSQRDASQITVDGKNYLNFSSNDYLGLSHHPALLAGWRQGIADYGAGAGASTHVTGYHHLQAGFEQQLADWLGYPCALLFISGFAANQALIAALAARGDRILADRLMHASLLEAALQSPASLRRFTHNQPAALARLLDNACEGETLVVSEGIFSMDGDSAPLADLQRLTQQHQGLLLIDDAHGIGVAGAQGRGSCWQQQVMPDLLVVTFGKAFGLSGAAVLCGVDMAGYLLQFCRHLIYSTAMPPAQIFALQTALSLVQQADDRRQRLRHNIAFFRRQAAGLPGRLMASDSAIQPWVVAEDQQALALASALRERGCWVSAIRPPTVPAGSARLRITLSACHEESQIIQLVEALADVYG
ncbi:8-amino-7-oxononanoate synthase [Erwinia sp. OLTSP20]|uniref:8-amino-7-oxononanoate synthase n=1 Tax=unclassified Erwinia TaxID=2622719 RepID=UPI000C19ED69|nr:MULTISPECIES: 8-amino-7-oxononanoate synthase [unclassified Erwinia]PIJ48725.1 8-amino-7-oxononanoate synthase [Erwinia sp. OAMSP11]PIJ69350.1 8-amino-7-oxononanoate synthase [Erwinia sp. OLSSP12]PIJ79184.1 8-amino-7-oxononanoate synthase [Erwinia sp. OLCASP19]PIJ80710.1 8-amino-7-oxononanoate synthase [Erwinia sp. OLMTSP26]PIJ82860.1 8-amino-7-oxononanoate synthase [Erwinia sp. OLMDSP33]